MKHDIGQQLIDELLAGPRTFVDQGRPYDLLQAYFGGFPVVTLQPLLRSGDPWVQRAAAFVASELGSIAGAVVDDVTPLLSSSDRHTQNYAMETLAVCCHGDRATMFGLVVAKMQADDPGIRLQAMDLVARASASQLSGAADHLRGRVIDSDVHQRCLRKLAGGDPFSPKDVEEMLARE